MYVKYLNRNYGLIVSSCLNYLPSRLLVVFNALIIVPVLAHLMSANELTVFQLIIGIINLVCTCSTDWISKSVLRFYEKYRLQNKTDEFFSNIVWITLIVYVLTILGYLLFSDIISAKLFLPKSILFFSLFLLIPIGLRQFLYQILRVFNRPFLYTFSIVFYQISLLALFLMFSHVVGNVFAILTAMAVSIFIIDFYVLYVIKLKIDLKYSLNIPILKESLKYALPQIVTNVLIWAVLNINRYVFQYNQKFEWASVVAASMFLISSVLTPLFSAFIFAVFPKIVKKFEIKNNIKPFVTNTIQLYCALYLPLAAMFCYYAKDLEKILLAGKFSQAYLVLPFFALAVFFQELMKIFNINYHLRNKTYVEMAVTIFVGLLCVYLNYMLIPHYGLLAAGLITLLSILVLFVLNILVQKTKVDFVYYRNILKTSIFSIAISLVVFLFIEALTFPVGTNLFYLLKILLYLLFTYFISFVFAKKILE